MSRLQITAILVVGLATAVRMSAQAPSPAAPAATPPARAAQTPAGNAEAGRKLFVSYGCYQCHGYEAQGSSATGPRLGPRPMQFAALSKYVRAPTGQMPPYTAKVLPDADLTTIYAFLQSRPAPPAVEDIPLLK
jgi:cytochrome c553